MLDAVDRGVAAALGDHHDLAALELEPAGAAAGRNLLLVEQQHRQAGVLDRRVQVPAHQALAADLQRQFRLLDDLDAVAGLLALAVAQLEQLLPVVDLGELRLAISCHSLFSTHIGQSWPGLSRWAPSAEAAVVCSLSHREREHTESSVRSSA